MFRFALSFVIATALLSVPAFAGGNGGTKKDATIRFQHDIVGGPTVVIIADPAAALVTKIQNSTATLNEITKAGGIVVRLRETKSLRVKAGDVKLYGSSVDERNGNTVYIDMATVPVAKGKTITLKASAL